MPAKYDPLVRYLAAQSGDRVMLTLTEIEAIIGASLSPGARRRSWWQIVPGLLGVRGLVLDGFWGREPVVTFVRDDTSDVRETPP